MREVGRRQRGRLHREEVIAGRRTGAACCGRSPREERAIVLAGDKRSARGGDFGPAGTLGAVGATLGGVAPHRHLTIGIHRGKGAVAAVEIGEAGDRGRGRLRDEVIE